MLGREGTKSMIPVGESVSGFFLKKVGYRRGPNFEGVEFSFVRDGNWINMTVYNPPKDDDAEMYKKRKYRAALKIESIISMFLDEEQMRECFSNAQDFKSFAELAAKELETTDYKTVELDLKILPGPKVGFAVPFVRKTGDKRRVLSYSDYELKTMQDARSNEKWRR